MGLQGEVLQGPAEGLHLLDHKGGDAEVFKEEEVYETTR